MLVRLGFSAPSSSVMLSAPPTPPAPAPTLALPPPPPTTESVTQQPLEKAAGQPYASSSVSVVALTRGTGALDARGDGDVVWGELGDGSNDRDTVSDDDELENANADMVATGDEDGRCVPSIEA